MREDDGGDRLHVVRHEIVAAVRERARLRDAQERDARARARAEIEARVGPRLPQQRDDVAAQALLDVHLARLLGEPHDVVGVGDRHERVERRRVRLLVEHLRLVRERRVAEVEPHREPVELRLGQRVRALVLDRVLGRDHHERALERMRLAVDRHLRLLHALEERSLRLRRRTVDLVDEQQVREDRPGPELEAVRPLVVDVDARDVGRQQVGRELEPGERAVERARERLREHRLPDAGKVLDDQVALGDETEDDEAQRLVGCVHDPAEVRDDRADEIRRRRFHRRLSQAGAPPRRGPRSRSPPSGPCRRRARRRATRASPRCRRRRSRCRCGRRR